MSRKVDSAAPQACARCPWRRKNQGVRPDPGKWYTKGNLARLWKQLRRGESMTCHPTDPENPIPEGSDIRPAPEGAQTVECAGALIIQQREFMKFQAAAKSAEALNGNGLRVYQKRFPGGMTREGLLTLMERQIFGGTAIGGVKMTLPSLDDEEIGYVRLAWDAAIAEECRNDTTKTTS